MATPACVPALRLPLARLGTVVPPGLTSQPPSASMGRVSLGGSWMPGRNTGLPCADQVLCLVRPVTRVQASRAPSFEYRVSRVAPLHPILET